MKPTPQEKYEFLCRMLEVQSVDLWEGDAMLAMPERVYFQFPCNKLKISVDEAVEFAMEQQ